MADEHSPSLRQVEEAFDRYGPGIHRRAMMILQNDAEAKDIVQEVFITAFNKTRSDRSFRFNVAWLRKVTVNLALNRIRDRKRRNELLQENVDPSGGALKPIHSSRLLVSDVLAAVDERCAQAAVCVYVDGMSQGEAAKILGVSQRTVSTLLTRFREAAQKFIGSEVLP